MRLRNPKQVPSVFRGLNDPNGMEVDVMFIVLVVCVMMTVVMFTALAN